MAKAGDNAAEFAGRFGVTVKALRVYEREGLLKPARTANGWRAYGRHEEEQLTAILALKRLGLPLARVRELLAGFHGDLDGVLALQESALVLRQGELATALAIIRRARGRLAAGASLSADDLTKLAKETVVTDMKWTPELEELAQKHYTPEQLAELRSRKFDAQDQADISAEWNSIFADGQKLLGTDPASPEAQAWVKRWKTAAEKFTMGRKDLWDSAAKFNMEAMTLPSAQANMPPGGLQLWQFASAAMKATPGKG